MSTSEAPKMCSEAAKFRIAPLQDEEDQKILFDKNVVTNVAARVPPSSQAQVDMEVDVEGSGSEAEAYNPLVTPVCAHGKNKRGCPYSPTHIATSKMSATTTSASRLDRMMELMEKREKDKERIRMMEEDKSKNSVTSPNKSKSRDEIRRLVALVYEDGTTPGSLEYFYATQLFILQEYREIFACFVEDATLAQRIEWIK